MQLHLYEVYFQDYSQRLSIGMKSGPQYFFPLKPIDFNPGKNYNEA